MEGGRPFKYKLAPDSMICDPLPTEAELNTWYQDSFNYDWYKKRERLKKIQAWHRWFLFSPIIKKYKKSGELLDLGCGHGFFLDRVKKDGYDTAGTDIGSSTTTEARRKGHNIYEGNFPEVPIKSRYDIITSWHCLEHFIQPESVLRKAHGLLKEDGILLIAVPNFNCAGVKKRGLAWVWIQQPFVHIWHWSPKALTALLNDCGFQPIKIITRDTWDANIVYDGYIGHYFEKHIHRALGKRLGFYITEGLRILSYVLSGLIPKGCEGSELLILAQKKKIRGAT